MKTYGKLVSAFLLVGCTLSAGLAQGTFYRSSPPQGLFFQGALSYSSSGALTLQYVLRNDGLNPIINDAQQIAVLYGADSIPIEVVRTPPPGALNLLKAGESEYGAVIIRDAPIDSDNLAFYWRLTEVGPNTRYALTRRFDEMNAQSLHFSE